MSGSVRRQITKSVKKTVRSLKRNRSDRDHKEDDSGSDNMSLESLHTTDVRENDLLDQQIVSTHSVDITNNPITPVLTSGFFAPPNIEDGAITSSPRSLSSLTSTRARSCTADSGLSSFSDAGQYGVPELPLTCKVRPEDHGILEIPESISMDFREGNNGVSAPGMQHSYSHSGSATSNGSTASAISTFDMEDCKNPCDQPVRPGMVNLSFHSSSTTSTFPLPSPTTPNSNINNPMLNTKAGLVVGFDSECKKIDSVKMNESINSKDEVTTNDEIADTMAMEILQQVATEVRTGGQVNEWCI